MKKTISIFMVLALMMCVFSGCSSAPSGSTSEPQSNTDSNDSSDETPSLESTEATTTPESGKVLVVYYSASGMTERVAGVLADTLSSDTFEIVPTEEYSDADLNWTDDNSRVSREHNDESLRGVPLTTTTVENWDSYDTVLIGYPIWWGIAAWPVDNFIKNNDFTGKTVIPFCTSSSSGLEQSGELLAEMAGTGEWQEGERFQSRASDSTVTEWANSLNLN